MSEPQPKEEKRHARFWWLLLFIFVLVAGATIAVIAMKNSANPAHVKFVLDSNGNPRLFGVTLSNTNIRDKTFSALSAIGFKGTLAIPSNAATNLQARDKAIETLKSMSRAGLFQTNSLAHPIPSPYE